MQRRVYYRNQGSPSGNKGKGSLQSLSLRALPMLYLLIVLMYIATHGIRSRSRGPTLIVKDSRFNPNSSINKDTVIPMVRRVRRVPHMSAAVVSVSVCARNGGLVQFVRSAIHSFFFRGEIHPSPF